MKTILTSLLMLSATSAMSLDMQVSGTFVASDGSVHPFNDVVTLAENAASDADRLTWGCGYFFLQGIDNRFAAWKETLPEGVTGWISHEPSPTCGAAPTYPN